VIWKPRSISFSGAFNDADELTPSAFSRTAYFSLTFAVLCFIGDAPGFTRENFVENSLLYAGIGLASFLTCYGLYVIIWYFVCRYRSLRRYIGRAHHLAFANFVVTIGVIPGIYLAYLIFSKVTRLPFDYSGFWAFWIYGVAIGVMINTLFAQSVAREEILVLRSNVVETRFNLLMAQMQPHFLFNSLNSLLELIATDQKTRAQEFTLKLSKLYRQILETSENELAELNDELEVVRAYLEIENIRFGDRLNFTITVDAPAEEIRVPSILLQPLIENAVKHGIAKSLQGGEIKIVIVADRVRESGSVTIKIQNTGAPLRKPIIYGSGLKNCVTRLSFLYGDSHQFTIGENSMRQTEVSFSIPFSPRKVPGV